jgi:hypothetical protein
MNAPFTLASLWVPHGDAHFCEQDCSLAVPMPVIFFASSALERMGVSSDSVGGSHAGYRQKRVNILLYLESFLSIKILLILPSVSPLCISYPINAPQHSGLRWKPRA